MQLSYTRRINPAVSKERNSVQTLSGTFCVACRAEALRMDDELAQCREEVRELKEENQHLRQASDTFGALADRLNSSLREERRKRDADRRSVARSQPDRRQSTAR